MLARMVATLSRVDLDVDSALVDDVNRILDASGVDMNSAVTAYFNRIADMRCLPFEIPQDRYTVDEVAGANWRDGIADLSDEWE